MLDVPRRAEACKGSCQSRSSRSLLSDDSEQFVRPLNADRLDDLDYGVGVEEVQFTEFLISDLKYIPNRTGLVGPTSGDDSDLWGTHLLADLDQSFDEHRLDVCVIYDHSTWLQLTKVVGNALPVPVD